MINGVILWSLSWLFPTLVQRRHIFSALLGGLVLGLSSAFLEALLGLNPPIVAEKYPEIRERIKDRQFYRTPMVPPGWRPGRSSARASWRLRPTQSPRPSPSLTAKTAEQAEAARDDNKATASIHRH